jgi:hypothetical protein
MSRSLLLAALIVAALLPAAPAVAMLPDGPPGLQGIHHRATTADLDRRQPTPATPPMDGFPWLDAAGLVVVAGASAAALARTRRARARSARRRAAA